MTGIQVPKRKEFSKPLHCRQHLPCPWCGRKARRISRREGKGVGQILYAITCIYKKCAVNPTTKWFKEPRYALSSWNRRKNMETTLQRFLRLRKKAGDQIPPLNSLEAKWEEQTDAGIRKTPSYLIPAPSDAPVPTEPPSPDVLDLCGTEEEEIVEDDLDLYDEQQ